MLASDGRQDFSDEAVASAISLADEKPVAVVTIAKIYGTRFGLPHPGLLPTKQELSERRGWIEGAIGRCSAAGLSADGQIAATRRASKKLAEIARVRGASRIVIDETPSRGVRRLIEGDVGAELRRRLRSDGVDVVVVPARQRSAV